MKRACKRRKVGMYVENRARFRCCICCKPHMADELLELSATIDIVDGSSSRTIAELIEEVASVKLKQVAQAICDACWAQVNTAYSIQHKIRRSKELQLASYDPENQTDAPDADGRGDGDITASIGPTADPADEVEIKFEVLLDGGESGDGGYECEYLDEYLDPKDRDYGDGDGETSGQGEVVSPTMSSLPAGSVHKEDPLPTAPLPGDVPHITRQFVMPREKFVLRDETHDLCRTLEVTGERCCGCSFIAENRKELLQHSGTVHAVEISDSGDYCPICFFKFASDEQLERHIREFKSTVVCVCVKCNRFYNSRHKFYNHLLRCGENSGEVSQDETDGEGEENEEYIVGDEYGQRSGEIECGVAAGDGDELRVPGSESITAAYQRQMSHFRARFDELVASEIFSCELDETELNVQQSQIADQYNFETFRYVRLRGERCCGCSFTCVSREQLMQHGANQHADARSRADDDQHTCSLCGGQFHEEREILKHLSFFTSKELFFCTICGETFLNRESLRNHQEQSERHRDRQRDKLQQEGIETIGPVLFVELGQPDVIEQLERIQAERMTYRSKWHRYLPMPESRFIKGMVEYNNYCTLTVVGQRCCGCGKYFDTQADLKEHSRQHHVLPLGSGWVSDHLQCDICYAVFDFERGLALHRSIRSKHRANLYLCKFCGLLFTKKFCLARHMQSAPNHLAQLIVDAGGNSQKGDSHGGQAGGGESPDGRKGNDYPAELDERISEALNLHRSVQEAGLAKAGHFVGYHCCFSKCSQRFTNEEDLLEHSHLEHKGKRRENESERRTDKHVCPCCCKAFQDLAKLTWHRVQRFVPRCYNCKHCDQSFNKWLKLKLHVESEHCESPAAFACTICGKAFVVNSRLKAHMKLHSTKKSFACDVCGYKFSSNGLMKRHRRSVHSTELPHECKLCPKRFAVIEKLQIHQRVHTGEKPFDCSYCPRAFSHYTDRKRHEMSAHTGERPHKCPYCPAAYIRNRELTLHMQKHKNEVVKVE